MRGLRTPLFDRLRDAGLESGVGIGARRVDDRQALIESIYREVSRILNTRAHLRGVSQELAQGTVLDYGLPDFSPVTAANEPELSSLGELIARKISEGEPRLAGVRVLLKKDPAGPKRVIGVIRAALRIGEVVEPVTFPLQIEGGSGPVLSDIGIG